MGGAVKQEFVNPFLTPAVWVWEQELKRPLRLLGAELVTSKFTIDAVTAVIGVTGKVKGNVLYEMDLATARLVSGTMLGEPVLEMDGMALSALGELANMITGNAATQLAEVGFPCDISPPVMLESQGASFSAIAGPQIRVRLESDLGLLHIRVALSEA